MANIFIDASRFTWLARSLEERVWTDALCIDWTNGHENTVDIGAMDVIYKCARGVVITLSDVYLYISEANVIIIYSPRKMIEAGSSTRREY